MQTRRKCSGACLSRRSSGGDRGTQEVPQRPPRRLWSLPAAAPQTAPWAPRVGRLGSRFAILYDAMCVSAYAIGASDEMKTMDMFECKVVTSSKKIYHKHMSSTAFSSTTNRLSQHPYQMLQRYTKAIIIN